MGYIKEEQIEALEHEAALRGRTVGGKVFCTGCQSSDTTKHMCKGTKDNTVVCQCALPACTKRRHNALNLF